MTFEKIIFGFLQAAHFGQGKPDVPPDFDAAIEMLAGHKTLQVQTFLSWPIDAQVGLTEMLTSWLIVFELAELRDDPMPIPSSWLAGSSSTRLNEKIVAEILHRSDALRSLHQRRPLAGPDR